MEDCVVNSFEIPWKVLDRRDFMPKLTNLIIATIGDLGNLGNYPICQLELGQDAEKYDCKACRNTGCSTREYLSGRESYGKPGHYFISLGNVDSNGLEITYRLNGREGDFVKGICKLMKA